MGVLFLRGWQNIFRRPRQLQFQRMHASLQIGYFGLQLFVFRRRLALDFDNAIPQCKTDDETGHGITHPSADNHGYDKYHILHRCILPTIHLFLEDSNRPSEGCPNAQNCRQNAFQTASILQ